MLQPHLQTCSNPVCSHQSKKNTSLRHQATLGVAALVGPKHDVVRCGISKSRWIAELWTYLAAIRRGQFSVEKHQVISSTSDVDCWPIVCHDENIPCVYIYCVSLLDIIGRYWKFMKPLLYNSPILFDALFRVLNGFDPVTPHPHPGPCLDIAATTIDVLLIFGLVLDDELLA